MGGFWFTGSWRLKAKLRNRVVGIFCLLQAEEEKLLPAFVLSCYLISWEMLPAAGASGSACALCSLLYTPCDAP
jgi:hypothetical protein